MSQCSKRGRERKEGLNDEVEGQGGGGRDSMMSHLEDSDNVQRNCGVRKYSHWEEPELLL